MYSLPLPGVMQSVIINSVSCFVLILKYTKSESPWLSCLRVCLVFMTKSATKAAYQTPSSLSGSSGNCFTGIPTAKDQYSLILKEVKEKDYGAIKKQRVIITDRQILSNLPSQLTTTQPIAPGCCMSRFRYSWTSLFSAAYKKSIVTLRCLSIAYHFYSNLLLSQQCSIF